MFTSVTSPASLSAILSKHAPKKIRHHVLDKFGSWSPANVQPHGRLQLQVKPSLSAQKQLGLPKLTNTSTQVNALAETGAQMCVADRMVAKRMNLTKSDLLYLALSVSVADNASLELIGAHFMDIYAESGQQTSQLVYFAHDLV